VSRQLAVLRGGGIDGSNIIGWYADDSGWYSFIYAIFEPATLLLLGLGAVIVRRKRS